MCTTKVARPSQQTMIMSSKFPDTVPSCCTQQQQRQTSSGHLQRLSWHRPACSRRHEVLWWIHSACGIREATYISLPFNRQYGLFRNAAKVHREIKSHTMTLLSGNTLYWEPHYSKTNMYTYMHAHTHVSMQWTNVHTHTHTQIHTHTHTHTQLHTTTFKHYTHTYTHSETMQTHTHTHRHTQTHT